MPNARENIQKLRCVLCFGVMLAGFGQAHADRRPEATENASAIADFSAREITQALFKAQPGERLNYSGKALNYLDLSGIDFKQATLTRSDLYGTDLTGSNLRGVDLSHARLDRAVLIRADLSGANLTGTTIYRPTVYTNLTPDQREAPIFAGANLTGIHVQAELSGSDFRGANLTDADFTPLEGRPGQGTLTTLARNTLKSCDFSGATLHRAKMTRTILWFARMVGADLAEADLSEADMSNADLTGANVTGVNFAGADLDGTNLAGVIGLDQAHGLESALNLDKAKR